MTKKQLTEILRLLTANYAQKYDKQKKKNLVDSWYLLLEKVPYDVGMNGLKKALAIKSDFMPTVGAFLEMCLTAEGCLTLDDEAAMEWTSVMRSLDRQSPVIFKNTVVTETIKRLGGWVKICGIQEKEAPFRRKEFIDIYKIVKRSGGERAKFLHGQIPFGRAPVKMVGFQSDDEKKAAYKAVEEMIEIEAEQNRLLTGTNLIVG